MVRWGPRSGRYLGLSLLKHSIENTHILKFLINLTTTLKRQQASSNESSIMQIHHWLDQHLNMHIGSVASIYVWPAHAHCTAEIWKKIFFQGDLKLSPNNCLNWTLRDVEVEGTTSTTAISCSTYTYYGERATLQRRVVPYFSFLGWPHDRCNRIAFLQCLLHYFLSR